MGSELVLKDSSGLSHFVKQQPSSLASNPTRPQSGHSLVPPSRRRSPRLNQPQEQQQKQTRLILPTLTPTQKKSVPIRGALLTPPDGPLAEDYILVESSSSEIEEEIHAPKTAAVIHLKPLQSEEMEELDDPAPIQSSDSDVESEDEDFQSRSSLSTAISQLLGDDQSTSRSNAPGNEEGKEAENNSTRSTSSESPKASKLDLSPVASGSDDLEGEAEVGSSRRKVFVDYQEPSTAGFSRDLTLPSMNRDESGPILSM